MMKLDELQHILDCIHCVRSHERMEDSYVTTQAVLSIIQIESGFRPDVVSYDGRGSIGLMQLLPTTARDMHVLGRQDDPYCSILAGMRFLNWLVLSFKFEERVLLPDWIVAYNVGLHGYRRGRRNERYWTKYMRARTRWAAIMPFNSGNVYSKRSEEWLLHNLPFLER